MKIKPEHFERLYHLMSEVIKQIGLINIQLYRDKLNNDPINYSNGIDIEMRIRWDLFNIISASTRNALMNEMYIYMDDTNIDTALKAITKKYF